MFDYVVDVAAGAAAIVAGVLPRRYWRDLPSLPIERRAFFSALLTLAAGASVGIPAYLEYTSRIGREMGAAIVKVAEQQLSRQLPPDPSLNVAPLAVSVLSPISFLFTPLGLLSGYLVVSAIARMVSVIVDDPFGDPMLTGIDAAGRAVMTRARERRQRVTRERAAGPETPDHLYTGSWAGLDDFDFVVVSSRPKPDWDAGTFVITSDKWYQLGVPFDLTLPEGLRTIYPLKEHTTLDVMRRGVAYQLPPLRKDKRAPVT